MFAELDPVALRSALPESGLPLRALGTVVHVYSSRDYEVEFVTATGRTIALLTLGEAKRRPVTDEDLLCVSHIKPSRYPRAGERRHVVREKRPPK